MSFMYKTKPIKQTNKTKPNPNPNLKPNMTPPYTDKRTGIVYADVRATTRDDPPRVTLQKKPHLDAFIPDAFLKSYFGGVGK